MRSSSPVTDALAEARERTMAIVAAFSDSDLETQHIEIMSPLVWDLAHIAAYEELWLVHRHAGLPLSRPELAANLTRDLGASGTIIAYHAQFERSVLRDLEQLLKLMGRLTARCDHDRLQTRAFHAQANLLLAGILSRQESFFNKMEEFHDRSGHASCRLPAAPRGDVATGDQPPPAHQSQCRAEDRQAAGEADSQTEK
jgi:hypothetical protein